MADTKDQDRAASTAIAQTECGNSPRVRADNTYALVLGLIATLCGITLATFCGVIAALIAALLDSHALEILKIGGGTFGACLILEIALAALHIAVRIKSDSR